jgi:hypothetical protein
MAGNVNNTDPGQIALVQAAMDAVTQQQQIPVMAGTPVHPEIRQVAAPEQMGAGYRPASETDPR